MLSKRTLLNEEDEKVLRSKFLSALEVQPLESITLPLDTDSLTINRETHSRPIAPSPLSHSRELDESALHLNQDLVEQLGLKESS